MSDTKTSLEKMRPTAKPGSASPSCARHVGLPVFAVILCRKFAAATVFSWHFAVHYSITEMPQRSIAGNFAIAEKCGGRVQRSNQV
ncbi:hypothetical protein KIP88_28945 [Bradyrhizobium sp. SRL28]|uniref:hypothetical protein n=1 Tax=Bradyrhizobium sp. SRL28 TaxID=2836178 RepID=UPI001BDDDF1D|nr:hypothetical protein [Bradyrhizobium sp. SRL28]MBT1514523.1 hypothetical protein [Bradyrhizobium sp. SRL28]